MIGTRGFVKRVRKGSGSAGRKCVAIGSARCVAVAPPLPFAVALSPWSGGLFHPPLTIPPVQGLCALYPAPPEQGVPPSHPEQGPCP
jgi:hypothetical protein